MGSGLLDGKELEPRLLASPEAGGIYLAVRLLRSPWALAGRVLGGGYSDRVLGPAISRDSEIHETWLDSLLDRARPVLAPGINRL